MINRYFWQLLWELRLNRNYLAFAVVFGITSLTIPLGVQYIVNNLALAGIWSNTVVLILIVSLGLLFSLFLNYGQFIIREYLQRHIFTKEIDAWKDKNHAGNAHYYLELANLMKSYSSAFGVFIELALILIVGHLAIVLMHPYFVVFVILIFAGLYILSRSTTQGVNTSIKESDGKYDIFYDIKKGSELSASIKTFMTNRHAHYRLLKYNNTVVLILAFLLQAVLLASGVWLIENQELSVGQFVSAEIIMSGIVSSLMKLPRALEVLYDFETSKYKLELGLGRNE